MTIWITQTWKVEGAYLGISYVGDSREDALARAHEEVVRDKDRTTEASVCSVQLNERIPFGDVVFPGEAFWVQPSTDSPHWIEETRYFDGIVTDVQTWNLERGKKEVPA